MSEYVAAAEPAGAAGAGGARRRTKPAAERRKDILAASQRLFREKGYTDTTVQDVADAAGVAIGTVYFHYESKEHILTALHETFHAALADEMADVALEILERRERGETIDLAEAVGRLLDTTASFLRANAEACEVVMRYLPGSDATRSEKAFVAFLARLLEEGIREGVVATSDPEMAAWLMSAAIGFTTGSSVAFGEPEDLDRLIAAAKEFLTKALAP